MSTVVVVMVVLAGLSEAAGRILPLVARRTRVSRTMLFGLLLTGTVVEATVITLWPLTASVLAELTQPTPHSDALALTWTPARVAPLLLAAGLAFPLLGPALHLLLLVGVGAGLVTPLAETTGLSWWTAAGCVAVAGIGLAAAVDAVRRLVAMICAPGKQELGLP